MSFYKISNSRLLNLARVEIIRADVTLGNSYGGPVIIFETSEGYYDRRFNSAIDCKEEFDRITEYFCSQTLDKG